LRIIKSFACGLTGDPKKQEIKRYSFIAATLKKPKQLNVAEIFAD